MTKGQRIGTSFDHDPEKQSVKRLFGIVLLCLDFWLNLTKQRSTAIIGLISVTGIHFRLEHKSQKLFK